jgi:tetratricopeptide (TPR) repeat protein
MLDAHLFYYLRNFVWPFEMRVLAQIEIHDTLLSVKPLLGLAFILTTLAAAWFFRRRQPLVSFCILAYWGFLALTSSIFPFRFEVTDYRQYLSSAFLCLLVALAIGSIRPKAMALTLSVFLTAYFALSTHALNRNWATEESLWAQSVRYGGKALAHHNYAMSIVDSDPEKAREHYEQALRMSPNHIYASIGLAMLELRLGETDAAFERLHMMTTLNPKWGMPRYWLAVAYETIGDREAALGPALEAANLDGRSLRFQHKAATLLQRNGRQKDAIEYFERVVRINPDFQQAEFALAFAYQKAGQSSKAIAAYRNFLERNPDHVQTHFNLGYELRQREACAEAIEHLETALKLRPTYREAHLYIAQCYEIIGDEDRAGHHRSEYLGRAKPGTD